MKVFLSLFARNMDYELAGRNKEKVAWKHTSFIAKVRDGLPVLVRPAVPSMSWNLTDQEVSSESIDVLR